MNGVLYEEKAELYVTNLYTLSKIACCLDIYDKMYVQGGR